MIEGSGLYKATSAVEKIKGIQEKEEEFYGRYEMTYI